MVNTNITFPDGNFIEAVRTSCNACASASSPDFKINEEAISTFLNQINLEQYTSLITQDPFSVPLRFDNLEDEINLLALRDLLEFGCGFRKPLHKSADRGASETILFGILSMHISGQALTAAALSELTISDISNMFGLPLHDEKDHPTMPGLRIGEPHIIRTFADKITKVLNDTGDALTTHGYANFPQFILDVTKPPNDKPEDWKGPSAAELVRNLVQVIPGFRDMSVIDESPVYLFKKAQLLASDLGRKYGKKDPERFGFYDADQFTVFADNVLPALLVHYSIIELSDELKSKIENNEEFGMENSARLRAVAVEACERVIKQARTLENSPLSSMTGTHLDYYLWKMGKVGELRKIERHVDTLTIFY